MTQEQFLAITEPLSRIYAIPDHLHALSHMLGDGLVPSNAKAGYLARMLARRILRMRDELGIEVSLSELIEHHLDINMEGHDMKQTKDGLLTIMSLEEERYREVLRKGSNLINQSLKSVDINAEQLPDELLFQLNDSHGLPLIWSSAWRRKWWNQLDDALDFQQKWPNDMRKWRRQRLQLFSSLPMLTMPVLPETVLYYNDVQQRNFDAAS